MKRRQGLINQNNEGIKQRSGTDQPHRGGALLNKPSNHKVRGVEKGGIGY